MSEERPCVLLGVTGCIAAYKACEIVRGLQKAGVRVKVVMTEHATEFIGPTTFRALTHEKVAVGLFDDPSDPIHHISLAEECDAFLIAPCTANVMAKIAHGIADDLLSTTALATTSPLIVAPACNVHMYETAATQENMRVLEERGVHIVEGDAGYLACGDVGRGRMAEPHVLVQETLAVLEDRLGAAALRMAQECFGENALAAEKGLLAGKTVLVTAGPTVEPIDAVRYISNYSSGKMGYAIAVAAREAGARVVLVSGPVALDVPEGMEVVQVKTAREMLEAAESVFASCDVAVFSAAVADVRPANPAGRKLKKGADDAALASIALVENPDILATLAATKRPGQFVVGFAAETNDVLENARAKLARKNADLIVANQVGVGRAFGTDDNEVLLVSADGAKPLPRMSKHDIARKLIEVIAKRDITVV